MKVSTKTVLELLEEASPKPEWSQAELEAELWDTGLLDSFSIVRLIGLLEERLGIVFDYSDLTRRNFETVNTILNLLKSNYAVEVHE